MFYKYSFYLDIEANLENPDTKKALNELNAKSAELKILGCYAKQEK